MHQSTNTTADLYYDNQLSQYVNETRSTGVSIVKMLDVHQPEEDYSHKGLDNFYLALLTDSELNLSRDIGDGKRDFSMQSGQFEIIPPNYDTQIEFRSAGKLIFFDFPFEKIRSYMKDEIAEFDGHFGSLHKQPFNSPSVVKLCHQLWREGKRNNLHGKLYSEGLTLQIVAELLKISKQVQRQAPLSTYTLSERLMHNIADWADANCDSRIDVEQLAALCNMSVPLFYKAFKHTAGLTPHQFILERRILKAKDLLKKSSLSLSSVAYQCGFSSQQHMTSLFSNRLGVTPSTFRKISK